MVRESGTTKAREKVCAIKSSDLDRTQQKVCAICAICVRSKPRIDRTHKNPSLLITYKQKSCYVLCVRSKVRKLYVSKIRVIKYRVMGEQRGYVCLSGEFLKSRSHTPPKRPASTHSPVRYNQLALCLALGAVDRPHRNCGLTRNSTPCGSHTRPTRLVYQTASLNSRKEDML
jgi:hypothetical protein